MPRRLTTQEFIEKARAVHGDRYDYSKAEYDGSRGKVTIVCPDHGSFQQIPNNHLNRAGCPDCGRIAAVAGRKYTTNEFVERAKAVHGERYDYSEVDYSGHRSRVTISCPDHGPFIQTPAQHLKGKGCPACGSKALNTDEFVERAKSVHGEHYDYSKVDYTNSYSQVTIICPEHGAFQQISGSHLRGHGCSDCASIKHTTESFIHAAKSIHGHQYDYSRVNYIDNKTKVTIICPEHGPFKQRPDQHINRSYGCRICSGNEPLSNTSFIKKARAVHGDRYDYSSLNTSSAHSKVTIICPDHGPFLQTPNNHIVKKAGCPDCAPNKPLSTVSFIEKATELHGDRYDYSLVNYSTSNAYVTIVCREHGPFEQVPGSHLQGHGCPDCAESGFNPNRPGILYYLAITTDEGDTRYKIGITNLTIVERFRPLDLARIRIVRTWGYSVGRHAADREAAILSNYAGDRYYGPPILQSGNTELFTHDILGLDHQPM